jgi:hypothetical protein
MGKSEGCQMNVPIGFHGGPCATCVLLAVHEVYWLWGVIREKSRSTTEYTTYSPFLRWRS